SSFVGKTSYDADNRPLLVMRSNLWASGYDVDGTDQTTLMRPSLVLFLVLWLKLVKDFLKVRCRLALLPFLISCLIWLDLVASLPLIKERILVIILLLHFLSLMLGSVLVLMLPLLVWLTPDLRIKKSLLKCNWTIRKRLPRCKMRLKKRLLAFSR